MNILYLAHRIPFPPDKGDKLRAFRHIEHLSRRHRVWCACFIDVPADRRHIRSLARYCQEVMAIPVSRTYSTLRGIIGLVAGKTMTESFYRRRAMTAALRRWSAQPGFDVVVAFSSSMAQYAGAIPVRRRVLDLCDCDSQKWLDYADASRGPARWGYRLEGRRLAERERAFARGFDATLFITAAEAAIVQGAPAHKLHVIGNGVSRSDSSHARRAFPRTVGFVGVMNYRPNIDAVCWFAASCWPHIRRMHPDADFRIVGRAPVRRVRQLERIPGVCVAGAVEDIQNEVREFNVCVAPLRIARGLQNKVLEAMAAAKPVVVTSKVAAGINARNGEDYCVADTSQETVSAVVRLLNDPIECDRIGASARRFVAVHHRWPVVLRHFELVVTGGIEREELWRPPFELSNTSLPPSIALASR